ncbi:MAG: hypothetical protein SGI73_13630 [Chloroflexota bacterium]|nr:hypothetical protein [Chloroflexota bacterium]
MSYRESETVQHQRAKSDIAAACARAGYSTRFEAIGDGWRADVLAFPPAQPETRLAFEVQWSPLTFEDTLMRQRRYSEAGVRGCWFFRTPPPKLQTGDPLRLRARRDLPLFKLLVNADGSFDVALNGRLHRLGAFVEALLRRQIRFCTTARASGGARVQFAFIPMTCTVCGRIAHIDQPDFRLTAACGALVQPPDVNALTFAPAVRAAAEQSARANGYRVKALESGFACAYCGTPFAPQAVEIAVYGSGRSVNERRALEDTTEIALPAPMASHLGHWCYPPDGNFCD